MPVGVPVRCRERLHPPLLTRHVARNFSTGGAVHSSTTIGFPHGGHATSVKVGGSAAGLARRRSRTRYGDQYQQDAAAGTGSTLRTKSARSPRPPMRDGAKIKVIFENAYLDDAMKIRLCEICGEIGVDWVKTSTGYAPSGATRRRPATDAEAFAAERAGQGGGWHPDARRSAGSAGGRSHPRRRVADGGHTG